MRKVFDLVSMTALELAIKRIWFPEKLIIFIRHLYKDHEIRIITERGLTSFFTASDRIDQGEVILPLMQRIFYDPLLVRIQQAKLGYQMCLEWPSDISKNITKVEKIEVSALAYADNTIWVVASKELLQSIINISNEFFKLNDIEINRAKSELIIQRPNIKTRKKDSIQIGISSEYIEAKKVSESIKFLGI